jgi:phosphoglycerate dehydrogenase-like enzyme
VIVTSHVAGYGERYVERCARLLLENVARLEAGAPREGVIDRSQGY